WPAPRGSLSLPRPGPRSSAPPVPATVHYPPPAASGPADPEHARVLQSLSLADPESAARLAGALCVFPKAGTEFLGFRLITERGRGAFGRVYLARQGELADRPVALKVSGDALGESRTLAQLQHTNIVPVYSVHHASPFHAVCMPYLGPVTLADALRGLQARKGLPDS